MKVTFMPQNLVVEATSEKSLLKIATENKIEIRSICKGVPSCAECRIRIVEGEGHVLPPTKAELNLIGTNYFIDGRRLSCQVRCFGDITVDLTEQVERGDNQNKKIRGFRTAKNAESQAVNDTLLLNEKDAGRDGGGESSSKEDSVNEAPPAKAPQAASGNRDNRQRDNNNNNQRSQRNNNQRGQQQGQRPRGGGGGGGNKSGGQSGRNPGQKR